MQACKILLDEELVSSAKKTQETPTDKFVAALDHKYQRSTHLWGCCGCSFVGKVFLYSIGFPPTCQMILSLCCWELIIMCGTEEQTATYLHSAAEVLLQNYEGSLFKLREAAGKNPDDIKSRLKEIKGLAEVSTLTGNVFIKLMMCESKFKAMVCFDLLLLQE